MNYNDEMISKIFLERNKFAIIGLTGRTGSGCTTAATILENDAQKAPELKDITYKGKDFFHDLNNKRYTVIKNYYDTNKKAFFSIKVSDLISAYILNKSRDTIFDFIMENSTQYISETNLSTTLLSGSFAKNKINHRFKNLIEILTDHNKSIKEIDA